MSQELTDRTYCVLIRGGVELWITPPQRNAIFAVMENDSKTVQIDDNLVRVSSIDGVLSADVMKTKDRIKQGEWKCEYEFWHTKGQECGHGLQNYLQGLPS